ncbi:MAG TPA: D-glycero-beta-D-manno-heptose 1-phosphate adenylyltransferase [Chloroflexia bacterium]|nr:D-glycero-beta-D-manno-heptose 1-phosphate adenylyltransferase [Chloroflexia bacterium]
MILERSEVQACRAEWRTEGKRVVFTNGCFDLIHLGHVRYLEEARALGDVLVLGLNSDSSVRQLKGPQRPLVSQDERAIVMSALRPVDHVVIFDELTAEALIAELQPDVYVKGGDYSIANSPQPEGKPLPEADIVHSYGGEVALIPFLPGHSTSDLIKKIVALYSQQ